MAARKAQPVPVKKTPAAVPGARRSGTGGTGGGKGSVPRVPRLAK